MVGLNCSLTSRGMNSFSRYGCTMASMVRLAAPMPTVLVNMSKMMPMANPHSSAAMCDVLVSKQMSM